MGKTANLDVSANYSAGGFKVGLLGLEHAQLSWSSALSYGFSQPHLICQSFLEKDSTSPLGFCFKEALLGMK